MQTRNKSFLLRLTEQEYATLIPQLFLEQMAEGILRTTSSEEMLDRTLNE